jgi:hypothetical protein
MSPISTSVIIASAGNLTMASNSSVTVYVTWNGFISPNRWSRIWPAIQSAGDSDFHQTVAITEEGSLWDLSNPATTVLFANLQTTGSGAPVVANIESERVVLRGHDFAALVEQCHDFHCRPTRRDSRHTAGITVSLTGPVARSRRRRSEQRYADAGSSSQMKFRVPWVSRLSRPRDF